MNEQAHGAMKRAHTGYSDGAAKTDASVYFREALDAIAPGKRAPDLVSLFGNRVDATTIRHWITGRRTAPYWALEIVRRLMLESSQSILAKASRPIVRGPTRSESARRLTPLRRAKEKARQQAALESGNQAATNSLNDSSVMSSESADEKTSPI